MYGKKKKQPSYFKTIFKYMIFLITLYNFSSWVLMFLTKQSKYLQGN